MCSRVLSGVRFLEVLAYFLPLCNEDTGPVSLALIISRCDILGIINFVYSKTIFPKLHSAQDMGTTSSLSCLLV
ncbi:hypothetical protein Hdeb2414_s0016g00491021 [Helianthus debilis subsp. tardiflorus]